jgi:hypothetical protein
MHIGLIPAAATWDTLVGRVTDLGTTVGRGAVGILMAVAVLLVGWAVAALGAWLARALARLARLDRVVAGTFGPSPAGYTPSAFLGWVIYWTVLAIAVTLALDTLGFDISGPVGARLAEVVPRIVSAAAIFGAGLLVAMLLGALTRRMFETAGMRGARARSLAVSAVLAVFAGLIALDQLGFAAQFVMAIGAIAVGSVGLAAGLAFGLGCRDLSRDFVIEYLRSLETESPRRPVS